MRGKGGRRRIAQRAARRLRDREAKLAAADHRGADAPRVSPAGARRSEQLAEAGGSGVEERADSKRARAEHRADWHRERHRPAEEEADQPRADALDLPAPDASEMTSSRKVAAMISWRPP
jgi:hypothetical protein